MDRSSSRPEQFGLPPKFERWRKGQDRAVEKIVFAKTRFVLLVTPVGSGKSATYMASALLNQASERSVILTATRPLQDQLLTEFGEVGLVDIRGKQNYVCDIDEKRTAATAICNSGMYCELKKSGCSYYDTKRVATKSQLVNTNYSFWLHDFIHQSIGETTRLILDEGHKAIDEIERFAGVEIKARELATYGCDQPPSRRQNEWKLRSLEVIEQWIQDNRPRKGAAQSTHTHATIAQLRAAKELQQKFARLCRLSEQEWLISPTREGWKWDLLEPGVLAEDLLFRGASKVVVVSATANRKTLEMLGVDRRDVTLIEQESTFPVARRPIYFWPVARVGYSMSPRDEAYLRQAMDHIITTHPDQKGLIHSVSYARARSIVDQLVAHRRKFLLHRQGEPLSDVIAEFRRRRDSVWLVTPAASEGISFPYEECEVVIIPKMPFPDLRDPLVKAKTQRDRDYIPYATLQTFEQMIGRAMRAEDDQCETYVLDDNLNWLKGGYWHYLHRWSTAAIKTIAKREKPPAPMKKLSRKAS